MNQSRLVRYRRKKDNSAPSQRGGWVIGLLVMGALLVGSAKVSLGAEAPRLPLSPSRARFSEGLKEWRGEPATSLAARLRGVGSASVQVWYESALKQVLPDAHPPNAVIESVELAAAGGECEAFQAVLLPQKDAAGVCVRWEDLLGPGVIPRESGRAAWVEATPVEHAPFGQAGILPNLLLPAVEARRVQGGRAQPIWLTIQVPHQAKPGLYQGFVRIEGESRDFFYWQAATFPTLRLPVRLRVRPFALPEKPTLTTFVPLGEFPPEARSSLFQNLREHRVSGGGSLPPVRVHLSPSGEISLDFGAFDEAAEEYLERAGLHVFEVPGMAVPRRNARGECLWNGLSVPSAEFQRVFSEYVRQVAEHLREKGWLNRALVRLCAEPHTPEAQEECRRLAEGIRAAAPDLRLLIRGMPDPAVLHCVHLWSAPVPEGLYAMPPERRLSIWGRVDRLSWLEGESAAVRVRAFAWRLKRLGVAGAEWDAACQFPELPPAPPHLPSEWEVGPVAPEPEAVPSPEPADTIPWEMYREGVEDYDVLTLLEEAHARARRLLNVQDPRFAANDLLARVLYPVVPSDDETTCDPRRLLAARALADGLVALFLGDPVCLLRWEGVGRRVQIEGITLPGTQVYSGHVRVAVGTDGRFRLRPGERLVLSLSRGGQHNGIDAPLPR